MNEFLKKMVKTNERYMGFSLYDKPIIFKETPLFSDKYAAIQIHDATPFGENSIIGFCGVCKVENDRVIPLDGDLYSKNMTVWGYSEFTDSEGNLCLDLLVDEW